MLSKKSTLVRDWLTPGHAVTRRRQSQREKEVCVRLCVCVSDRQPTDSFRGPTSRPTAQQAVLGVGLWQGLHLILDRGQGLVVRLVARLTGVKILIPMVEHLDGTALVHYCGAGGATREAAQTAQAQTEGVPTRGSRSARASALQLDQASCTERSCLRRSRTGSAAGPRTAPSGSSPSHKMPRGRR
jgi:hypothetical protein